MTARTLSSVVSSALRRGSIGLSLCGLSVAAFGDDAATQAKAYDAETLQEVVVTGTLIHGKEPVGSYLIEVGPATAESQGATTVDDLLATVPQVSNLFNNVPGSVLNIAPNQIQVVSPNLRSLAPPSGSSSSTLVLFDGHRVAGVGVTQSAVDPDLIPVGAIERVEVLLDGGSATYGTDAVGGVVNFITRKRFDGVKVDGHYGFADGYHTSDGNLTAGKDWGSGSLWGSVMVQSNDAIFGRDRDFIRQVDWTTPTLTPIGRQCNPGNVTLPGAFDFTTFTFGPSTNYGLPNLTKPGFNACDATNDASFVPSARRDSAIIGLHQEIGERVTIDVKAFYGQRTSSSYQPMAGQATVSPTNAFYEPAAANPAATQTVSFTFDPVLGRSSAPSGTAFYEWGANGEVSAKISDDWHLRTLLNYSTSSSAYHIVGLNQALLAAAGGAADPQAAVNFYNPAATPNLAVIRAIANSEIAGQGQDSLFNARQIVEGGLFRLPGGQVRMAAGYEFLDDKFEQRVAPANAEIGAINSVGFTPYDRTVHALFGEFLVPVVGEGNRMGGIYSIDLSASVRHDRYSDFGSTTNYKFGVSYKPLEWLALRGNYSTSFQAPSPVDQLGSLRNTIGFFPFNAFVRPGDTPVATGTVALQGAQANLNPQTAKTYSFGADINPISELKASVNYYHVKFENLLSIPTPSNLIFRDFPNNVTSNVNGVSSAQLLAFAKLAPNGLATVQPLIAAGVPVYELVNFLEGNYGDLNVSGMDFTVNYREPTFFGSVDGSVSGDYTLERKSQIGPGSPEVDLNATNNSKLLLQATLGADIKNFRAQMTLNHSSGFGVVRSVTLPQDHVSAFDTVNLFLKYNIPGENILLKDLSFTLNVNNLFDTDPPVYKLNTGNGYYGSEFTLGRLVMFGVSKKF